MRYQGSEAYSMRAAERGRERSEQQARPSFEVVSGGGLDARARAGVSPAFVARVRAVVAVAAVLIVLGMGRVALSAATVTLMQSNATLNEQISEAQTSNEENATLNEQISEAQTSNEELMIERSVLSGNARITRIATQNYGMALPSGSVHLDLSEQAEDATDGEAAQTDAGTGEQADMS